MAVVNDAVDASITEVDRLRKFLRKNTSRQVSSGEERAVIKATCLAWFNNHRKIAQDRIGAEFLEKVDAIYKGLIAAADRSTTRSTYDTQLKVLKGELSALRATAIDADLATPEQSTDAPPSFAPLVPDPRMQAVLVRRWQECAACVGVGAPLAATVMMGGLVEALLLARVLREPDKTPVFGASSAPKDPKTGKPVQLQEWTLRHFIDVAHELGWITRSAKDVGEVVRDYRNYIHPQKELSHGVALAQADAELFWGISKTIVRQLLK